MPFVDIYKKDNSEKLAVISWINKNLGFDTSTGNFKSPDLFTFLANIESFKYDQDIFYDDFYYIIEYTKDSISYLLDYINTNIRRSHKILPLSMAKEFDNKSIMWISRKNGRNVREKLSDGKVKTVKREYVVDTQENRVLKIFLKKILLVYESRNDLSQFAKLFNSIDRWLKTDTAEEINERKKIIYNNILLHHPKYSKIFKSLKWLGRLDDKYEHYLKNDIFTKKIINILKFEILKNFHYSTKVPIFPNTLDIEPDSYCININFPKKWTPDSIDILRGINNLEIKSKDEFSFFNIHMLANKILDTQLKIQPIKKKKFFVDAKESALFIDLFRLSPIALVDNKIVKFPLMLKQIIDENFVEATNTEIINLSNPIITLSGILNSYDTNAFKYFMDSMRKFFDNKKIYYIIPDYINIFDFSPIKRLLNSYFKHSRPIPKSILAGLKMVFEENIEANNTLYYLQIDCNANLYITPLVAKYDKKLQNITNGIFLERYPTKKIDSRESYIDELKKIIPHEYMRDFLANILKKDLADIVSKGTLLFFNEKSTNLNKLTIKNEALFFSTIKDKISEIYNDKMLVGGKNIILKDDDENNLMIFKKLASFESDGYILWTEHLPNLSIEVIKNGYFSDFVLVDKRSKLVDKNIDIKENFIIPAGESQISFALKFGDERTNYRAVLKSPELPYRHDEECKLELTYDYDKETPYELIFKPLQRYTKNINVLWEKIEIKGEIPEPQYPKKKSWSELQNLPTRLIKGFTDLIDITEEELKIGYFKCKKIYKYGKSCCLIEVDGEDIFCHSEKFKPGVEIEALEKGQELFLKIYEHNGRKYGKDIAFNDLKEIDIKLINLLKFLVLSIWRDCSIKDLDAPVELKEFLQKNLMKILKICTDKKITKKHKEKLLEIIAAMHSDIPEAFSRYLLEKSSDMDGLEESGLNCIAVCIGNCELEWQKEIFDNILSNIKQGAKGKYLGILGQSLWRSKNLVDRIKSKEKVLDILNLLSVKFKETLNKDSLRLKNIRETIQQLELLLAILRIRNRYNILRPDEQITGDFIDLIDLLYRKILKNDFIIKSYIEFEISKPEFFKNVPDLIYVLRVYLIGDTKLATGIKILGVKEGEKD